MHYLQKARRKLKCECMSLVAKQRRLLQPKEIPIIGVHMTLWLHQAFDLLTNALCISTSKISPIKFFDNHVEGCDIGDLRCNYHAACLC